MRFITLLLLGLVIQVHCVRAQESNKDEVICALSPDCKPKTTRGFNMTVDPKRTSLDIRIQFDFDSAILREDAKSELQKVGEALRDEKLRDFNFMVAGHTDAAGADDYNQRLSELRAQAVRQYLVEQFGLKPERIEAVGYGKTRLADPSRPNDEINRRAEIANVSVPERR
jgi:outer membrane protein OmpA-like peptidoglycan-associated protein